MSAIDGAGRIPLQLSRGCVVASIQVDLSDEVLLLFKRELLELLHSTGARGVVLDVSGVELMDIEDFESLHKVMAMGELMGARCLLAGLRPGVVSALVDMGVDTGGIEAVLNLDEAFRVLGDSGHDRDGVDPAEGTDDEAGDEDCEGGGEEGGAGSRAREGGGLGEV
jgi:rsbT antagonist protein RsbS